MQNKPNIIIISKSTNSNIFLKVYYLAWKSLNSIFNWFNSSSDNSDKLISTPGAYSIFPIEILEGKLL